MEQQKKAAVQQSVLADIAKQLRIKPTSTKISFPEYQKLSRETYSLRLRVKANPHQVHGVSFESLLQKVISLEQSLKFSEETKRQLEFKINDLLSNLENEKKEKENMSACTDHFAKLSYQIWHINAR